MAKWYLTSQGHPGRDAAMKRNTKFTAILIAGFVTLFAGCQTPRHMNAEATIAGQQIKVNFVR
jgi:hypothetical protein